LILCVSVMAYTTRSMQSPFLMVHSATLKTPLNCLKEQRALN